MRSRIHLCLGKPRDSEGKNQATTCGHLTWRGAAARAAASMPNFRFYGCIKAQGRGWGRGGGSWAESGLWELASRFSSPQISRIINAQGFGVRGMKYPNFGEGSGLLLFHEQQNPLPLEHQLQRRPSLMAARRARENGEIFVDSPSGRAEKED